MSPGNRFPRSLLIVLLVSLACERVPAQGQSHFEVTETTIAQTQAAIRAGKVTCHQLVESYLQRIRAYDQSSGLNSIVLINPNALAEAERLDREFKHTGKLRPLQGIAVIVKDNYDTISKPPAARSPSRALSPKKTPGW